MLDNKIKIEFLPAGKNHNYEITPYSFAPKVGKRLTSRTYLDLGQGILDNISAIYRDVSPLPTYDGIIIKGS